MSEFSLGKFAEALKAIGDTGAALIADAESRAKDGKVAAIDVEPIRKALTDAYLCIGPRPDVDADDSETPTDPTIGKQERAAGDRKKTAADSRPSVIDNRGRGPSNPLAGCGNHIERHAADTRHSIAGIFSAEADTSSRDHSLAAVFKRPVVSEG